jgi:hypothetical protein
MGDFLLRGFTWPGGVESTLPGLFHFRMSFEAAARRPAWPMWRLGLPGADGFEKTMEVFSLPWPLRGS